MSKQNRRRKKLWVQRQIQGGLVLRCAFYWLICLCAILLFVPLGTAFSGVLSSAGNLFGNIWKQYSYAVLAGMLLLPVVVLDVIRFSHRFVGPLVRLEQEMKKMADGGYVRPIQIRKDDHWHGLVNQYNRLVVRDRQKQKFVGDWQVDEEEELSPFESAELESVG